MTDNNNSDLTDKPVASKQHKARSDKPVVTHVEHGGPKGKEPTRYGDWEKKGRCIDF